MILARRNRIRERFKTSALHDLTLVGALDVISVGVQDIRAVTLWDGVVPNHRPTMNRAEKGECMPHSAG